MEACAVVVYCNNKETLMIYRIIYTNDTQCLVYIIYICFMQIVQAM